MAKEFIARGQTTIIAQQDAYTISQSLSKYVFPAANDGKITDTATITIEITVTQGDVVSPSFTIGAIAKPTGISSISVNNTLKSVTLSVAAGTTNLADHGKLDIPVIIAGITYHLSFVWSKAKAGVTGVDANMLDWVKEWNSGKTQIGESTIITPKLFAGVKNADATLTGTAIGRYTVTTKTAAGTLTTETIDGICGFKDGYKTFSLDNGGNVQLGRGDQYLKYNALTGKVEFGAGVSLLWAGATYINKNGIFTGILSASTINALHLDASQITSGKIKAEYIDVASVLTAGNIEALTLNVVRGKIGGWSIDADSIFRGVKNNISGTLTPSLGDITLGSNGLRGHMWSLDSSGAGAIAGGNIRWDAVGKVTFDKTVAVAWQNGIDTTSELARAMAYGRMLYRDPTFSQGTNTISSYNNSGNGALTLTRIANSQAPNDSHQVLEISVTGQTSPGLGGFFFATSSAPGKIFITRIIAKIPPGYGIFWASNAIGANGFGKCLTPFEGTGKWEEYIFKVVCGYDGVFSSTNHFYLSPLSSSNLPLVWQVAYATVFDVTSAEKLTTTIDGNGIYTGSITAGQITTGSLSADRIAAGSLKAEKLDVASIKASIVNAAYISGLNCTFTQGTIGGWTIGPTTLSSGQIVLDTAQRRLVVYHSTANKVSGQRVQIYYNSDSDFGIYATDIVDTCVFQLGSVNRIAGWAISNLSISKGNVELSADGSILNTSKWKLNNDGSGQLASGNISWNAVGIVTFSSAVSLNWTAPLDNITSALGGTAYPKLTNISATGIYTGSLTASQVNAVIINANSILTGILSADRIAAGSIRSEKLDAASIQANIINTNYISGLSCAFTQGTIGGWTIGRDNITTGIVGATGSTPIQLSSTSVGSGYWYIGGYRPLGLSMIWHQSSNAGHIVFGQIAASGNSVKSGFVGIQMMSWDHDEYFCLSANSQIIGAKEVYNRIAGWAFDHNHIWKNNVSLGADGSIANGSKWQLHSNGSGNIASGNIVWDEFGNVTFSDSVSLTWRAGLNAINATLQATYPKLTQITSTGIYTGTISAGQINVDTALVVGGSANNGSLSIRDASDNVRVTLDRAGITAVGGKIGGWLINQETIMANAPESGHRVCLASSGYLYNDNPNTGIDYWGLNPDGSATFGSGKILFQHDGSGYLANQNIKWDAIGNVALNGTITATTGKIAGFSISGNHLVNSASDSSIEFNSLIGNAFLYINSSSALISMRADSARTGINIETYATGARGMYILANVGSKYAIEAYGPMQLGQRGAERWCVPGVLYIGCKSYEGENNYYKKVWGDGATITSFIYLGWGQYKISHNLRHLDYTVLVIGYGGSGYYGFFRINEKASTYFIVQNLTSGGDADTAAFDFIIMGRNSWT